MRLPGIREISGWVLLHKMGHLTQVAHVFYKYLNMITKVDLRSGDPISHVTCLSLTKVIYVVDLEAQVDQL